MSTKINHLKTEKDFRKILREGKSVKEDLLVLKFIKNNFKKTRFAVSVSLKISKKATLRNKIKRRLRNLLGLKLPKIKRGTDLLLIALPGLENKDFWEIDEIVNKLFTKAKIFKND